MGAYADKAAARDADLRNARETAKYSRHISRLNAAYLTRDGYVPQDLHTQWIGFPCTKDGYEARRNDPDAKGCMDFKSLSEGTFWRIITGEQGEEGSVIFKLSKEKGTPQLWVKFRGGYRDVLYASPDAQQYAMSHGRGDTRVAQGGNTLPPPQTTNTQCGNLSGNARAICEGVGSALPGLGGILGK